MAKIKFGMMMTDARGKLGGQVFSKNRGGAYVRTKVTPNNPQTFAQAAVRANLGALSQEWNGLSEARIAAWNAAVEDWKTTNIFGDSVTPSGKSLFISLNRNLNTIGQPTAYDVPLKASVPFFPLSGAVIDTATGSITLDVSGTDEDTYLAVWATPPVSAGIRNYSNRYRLIYTAVSNALVPSAIYAAYVAKFGVPEVGANVSVRTVAHIDNGQVSPQQSVKATVVHPE